MDKEGQVHTKAALNYGDLPEEYSGFKRSKIVVVPVPYESTTTYRKGTKAGPQAIIEASAYMETYDDELDQETYKNGINTFQPLEVDGLDVSAMLNKVRDTLRELIKAGKFPVILGGEHTISIGAVMAFKETVQDISVLYLDAHYDMKDEFNDSKYNHACTARRICELSPVVEVGVRSLSKDEKDFVNNHPSEIKLDIVDVYGILNNALWKERVVELLSPDVYITIDLDIFDPAIVPSVGTPEPGGLGWYEFLELLNMVIMKKNIVGFDIMELCPDKNLPASDFFTAKLIYRLLGYIFSPKRLAQLR